MGSEDSAQTVDTIGVALTLDTSAFEAGLTAAKADLSAFETSRKVLLRAPQTLSIAPAFKVNQGHVRALKVDINDHFTKMAARNEAVAIPVKLGESDWAGMRQQIAQKIGSVPITITLNQGTLANARGGAKSLAAAGGNDTMHLLKLVESFIAYSQGGSLAGAATTMRKAAASKGVGPMPGMWRGGPVGAGQIRLVGEDGPEVVKFVQPAQVYRSGTSPYLSQIEHLQRENTRLRTAGGPAGNGSLLERIRRNQQEQQVQQQETRRPPEPEWIRRAREGKLPPKQYRASGGPVRRDYQDKTLEEWLDRMERSHPQSQAEQRRLRQPMPNWGIDHTGAWYDKDKPKRGSGGKINQYRIGPTGEWDEARDVGGMIDRVLGQIDNYQTHAGPGGYVGVAPTGHGGNVVQLHAADGTIESWRMFAKKRHGTSTRAQAGPAKAGGLPRGYKIEFYGRTGEPGTRIQGGGPAAGWNPEADYARFDPPPSLLPIRDSLRPPTTNFGRLDRPTMPSSGKSHWPSGFTAIVRDRKGVIVAAAPFNTGSAGDGGYTLQPQATWVDEDHRRKGLATAMYTKAERWSGAKVIPDDIQTDMGQALWRSPHRSWGSEQYVQGVLPKYQRLRAGATPSSLTLSSSGPRVSAPMGKRRMGGGRAGSGADRIVRARGNPDSDRFYMEYEDSIQNGGLISAPPNWLLAADAQPPYMHTGKGIRASVIDREMDQEASNVLLGLSLGEDINQDFDSGMTTTRFEGRANKPMSYYLHPLSVHTHPLYKGHGIASAMYEDAEKWTGRVVAPSGIHLDPGAAMWRSGGKPGEPLRRPFGREFGHVTGLNIPEAVSARNATADWEQARLMQYGEHAFVESGRGPCAVCFNSRSAHDPSIIAGSKFPDFIPLKRKRGIGGRAMAGHRNVLSAIEKRLKPRDRAYAANLRDAGNLLADKHKQGGKDWYVEAQDWIKSRADTYQKDPDYVRGLTAILSAGTSWKANKSKVDSILKAEAAGEPFPYDVFGKVAKDEFDYFPHPPLTDLETGRFMPGGKRPLGAHLKAWWLTLGASPESLLAHTPKTGKFYRNMGGDLDAITIDRWALRTATRGKIDQAGRGPLRTKVDKAFRQVAAEFDMKPAEFQAALWLQEKEKSENVLYAKRMANWEAKGREGKQPKVPDIMEMMAGYEPVAPDKAMGGRAWRGQTANAYYQTLQNGGGTFPAHRGMAPGQPSSGWAVGVPPTTAEEWKENGEEYRTGVRVKNPGDPLEFMRAFHKARKMSREVGAPYIGTWLHGGSIHVDPATVMDTYPEADQVGRFFGQRNLFNLRNFKSPRVRRGPVTLPEERIRQIIGAHMPPEDVPVSVLRQIQHIDRMMRPRPGPGGTDFDSLQRDIAAHGIHDPLEISYNLHGGYAGLTNGNHRLEVAERLGMETVPARVHVIDSRKTIGKRLDPPPGFDLSPGGIYLPSSVGIGAGTEFYEDRMRRTGRWPKFAGGGRASMGWKDILSAPAEMAEKMGRRASAAYKARVTGFKRAGVDREVPYWDEDLEYGRWGEMEARDLRGLTLHSPGSRAVERLGKARARELIGVEDHERGTRDVANGGDLNSLMGNLMPREPLMSIKGILRRIGRVSDHASAAAEIHRASDRVRRLGQLGVGGDSIDRMQMRSIFGGPPVEIDSDGPEQSEAIKILLGDLQSGGYYNQSTAANWGQIDKALEGLPKRMGPLGRANPTKPFGVSSGILWDRDAGKLEGPVKEGKKVWSDRDLTGKPVGRFEINPFDPLQFSDAGYKTIYKMDAFPRDRRNDRGGDARRGRGDWGVTRAGYMGPYTDFGAGGFYLDGKFSGGPRQQMQHRINRDFVGAPMGNEALDEGLLHMLKQGDKFEDPGISRLWAMMMDPRRADPMGKPSAIGWMAPRNPPGNLALSPFIKAMYKPVKAHAMGGRADSGVKYHLDAMRSDLRGRVIDTTEGFLDQFPFVGGPPHASSTHVSRYSPTLSHVLTAEIPPYANYDDPRFRTLPGMHGYGGEQLSPGRMKWSVVATGAGSEREGVHAIGMRHFRRPRPWWMGNQGVMANSHFWFDKKGRKLQDAEDDFSEPTIEGTTTHEASHALMSYIDSSIYKQPDGAHSDIGKQYLNLVNLLRSTGITGRISRYAQRDITKYDPGEKRLGGWNIPHEALAELATTVLLHPERRNKVNRRLFDPMRDILDSLRGTDGRPSDRAWEFNEQGLLIPNRAAGGPMKRNQPWMFSGSPDIGNPGEYLVGEHFRELMVSNDLLDRIPKKYMDQIPKRSGGGRAVWGALIGLAARIGGSLMEGGLGSQVAQGAMQGAQMGIGAIGSGDQFTSYAKGGNVRRLAPGVEQIGVNGPHYYRPTFDGMIFPHNLADEVLPYVTGRAAGGRYTARGMSRAERIAISRKVGASDIDRASLFALEQERKEMFGEAAEAGAGPGIGGGTPKSAFASILSAPIRALQQRRMMSARREASALHAEAARLAPTIAIGQESVLSRDRSRQAVLGLQAKLADQTQQREKLSDRIITRQGGVPTVQQTARLQKFDTSITKLTSDVSAASKAYDIHTSAVHAGMQAEVKQRQLAEHATQVMARGRAGITARFAGAGATTAGFITANALMSGVNKGIGDSASHIRVWVDSILGFTAVNQRVTKAIGESLRQNGGQTSTVFGQLAMTAGLGGGGMNFLKDTLAGASFAKGGAAAQGEKGDLFKAAAGNGAPTGLVGGYGGLLGSAFLGSELGGGKGLAETVGLLSKDLAEKSVQTQLSIAPVSSVLFDAGPSSGGITPGNGLGLTNILTPEAMAAKDSLSAYTVDLNDSMGRAATAAGETAYHFEQVGKKVAEESKWADNLGTEAQDMARGGLELKDAQGNLITDQKRYHEALSQIARGNTIASPEAFAAQKQVSMTAQFAGLGAQIAHEIAIVIPAQLGTQLTTTPFLPASTGILATGDMAGKDQLGKASAEVKAGIASAQKAQDTLTAMGSAAIEKQAKFIGQQQAFEGVSGGSMTPFERERSFEASKTRIEQAFASPAVDNEAEYRRLMLGQVDYQPQKAGRSGWSSQPVGLESVQSIGKKIVDWQQKIADAQLAISTLSYTNQKRLADRAVSDARGLAGLAHGQNNLGAVQREQTMLGFGLQQKQINFSVAMAGFQAPGLTSEERAARQEEARIEAKYAQKQLNLSRQGFGIEASRGVTDTSKARNILQVEWETQKQIATYNKNIAAEQSKQNLLLSKAERYVSGAEQKFGSVLQASVEYMGTFGKTIGEATTAIRSALGMSTIDARTGEAVNRGARSASGLLATTKGATDLTIGEAGTETVAVLRNPTTASFAGFGGGGGSSSSQTTVTLNLTVQGDVKDEATVAKIVRAVEDSFNRKAARLGMRSLGSARG